MSACRTRAFFAGLLGAAMVVSLAGCAKSTRPAASQSLVERKAGKASKKKSRPVKAEDLSDYIRKVMKLSEEARIEHPSLPTPAELLDAHPAIAARLRVLASDPQNIAARMELANLYVGYGAYDRALDEYRKVQALAPENPYVYEAMGRLWQRWSSPGAAVADLQKAIALKPDFADAYNSLGMAYDALGDYVQAEAAYQSALRIDPNLDHVHNNLCYNYILQKKLDQALAQCDLALQLNPASPTALNNRGFILAMTGEYDQALEAFSRATDPAGAHNNLGLIYLEKKMYDEALAEFQKAGQLRPAYRKASDNYELALRLRAGFPAGLPASSALAQTETAQARPAVAGEAAAGAVASGPAAQPSEPPVPAAAPAIVTQIVDFSQTGEATLSYLSQSAPSPPPAPSTRWPGAAPVGLLQTIPVAPPAPPAAAPVAEAKSALGQPSFQMIVFPSHAPDAVVPTGAATSVLTPPPAHAFSDPKLVLPQTKDPMRLSEVRPLLLTRAEVSSSVPSAARAVMSWARLRSFAQPLTRLSPVAPDPDWSLVAAPAPTGLLSPAGVPALGAVRISHLWPVMRSLSIGERPAVIATPDAAPLAGLPTAARAALSFERIFSPEIVRPALVTRAGDAPAAVASDWPVAAERAESITTTAAAMPPSVIGVAAPAVAPPLHVPGVEISLPALMVAGALVVLMVCLVIPNKRSAAGGPPSAKIM